MLRGFSIDGFRNFLAPQEILNLSRVNIFIGTNNSGKSNVLRYIERVLTPALAPARNKSIALNGIDLPRNGYRSDNFLFSFYFEPKKSIQQGLRWNDGWSEILRKYEFLSEDNLLTVPVTLRDVEGRNYFSGDVPQFSRDEIIEIQRAWSSVVQRQGGDIKIWFSGLLNAFINDNLFELRPHFIPSFRQLATKLDEFRGEYITHSQGDHLIDRLAELAHPPYDEQDKKQEFEKLRMFVAEIIDDPNVEIEIPANRQTLNIKSGKNFLPIEALGSGIHEVLMLAAELILNDKSTILLEEPEVHLHPTLQRRLMNFIRNHTNAQYFITTHSASIIDSKDARIFGVSSFAGEARVVPLLTSHQKSDACRELGFRASDLLQTNCIIWVEGPSDRIYLNSWIATHAPYLEEGIDYSIIFYGGKLLSHLTAEDSEFNDLIKILPISRRVAVLADSDKGSAESAVRETKLRVEREILEIGGFYWITHGREIENYFSHEDRQKALSDIYGDEIQLVGSKNRFGKPLDFKDKKGTKKTFGFDKIRIANKLIENGAIPSEECTLKVIELVEFITQSNVG